jgi:hypothetical protein
MNNLTQSQQEIVNTLISEFNNLNHSVNVADTNDLVTKIKIAIEEKTKLVKEAKITTATYDTSNKLLAQNICHEVNTLLNQFGYAASLKSVAQCNKDYTAYYEVWITWGKSNTAANGLDESRVFLYANDKCKEDYWHLADSSLVIYREGNKLGRINTIEELLELIATWVIYKEKIKIK